MRVHIDGLVRDLDVDSPYPPGAEAGKGWIVHPLKRHVSWVQLDVSQSGFYLVNQNATLQDGPVVREDSGLQPTGVSAVRFNVHRRVAKVG